MSAYLREMIVEQVALETLRDEPLAERVGVEVKDLLVQGESLDQRFRRGQPGHAQAGSQQLGIGTQVEYLAVAIKRLEWLRWLALEIHLTIGIVFQYGCLIAAGEQEQAAAAIGRHHHTGRIVKGGLRVDESRMVPRQHRFEQVDAHAVAVGWHTEDARAQRPESLNGSQIGGYLDHHFIARPEQHATEQTDTLCRAGENENLRGVDDDAAFAHAGSDGAAQAVQSLDRAVAQRALAGRVQPVVEDSAQHLDG